MYHQDEIQSRHLSSIWGRRRSRRRRRRTSGFRGGRLTKRQLPASGTPQRSKLRPVTAVSYRRVLQTLCNGPIFYSAACRTAGNRFCRRV